MEKRLTSKADFELSHLLANHPIGSGIEQDLTCATAHSLESNGSLNRANLATRSAKALGMPLRRARLIGSSIELFHLASLILDDLPCMDNASLRRGQPCTHIVFGESTAILTAMGFINRAYCLLWEAFSGFPENARQEANKLTDQCLGLAGILNGQARDIAFGKRAGGAHEILEIARLKTGSLLRLCLLLPAVLMGSDRSVKLHLARLADQWGTAYQIADDLKDIFCGESVSGKTACRDGKLGRPNLTLEIGAEQTERLLQELIEDAEQTLTCLFNESTALAGSLRSFQLQLVSISKVLEAANSAA